MTLPNKNPTKLKAWGKLIKLRKPILTCFSDKDPIMRGLEKVFIKNILRKLKVS